MQIGTSSCMIVDRQKDRWLINLDSKFRDLHLFLLEVVIGEGDDGLYIHVFPYTEEGGWDFEACKA